MKRILLTGGNGFIGHHFVEHFLKNTDWQIVVVDKLSYASMGNDRLRDIKVMDEKRVERYTFDLTKELTQGIKKELGEINIILHLAAETHVDNSITSPVEFMRNNLDSTMFLLEYARGLNNLEKFLYFSTDEVYGTAPQGTDYKEGDRHNPGNPYSASKSGSESIVRAYANTYRLPCVISNTMNVIGERQHPEKYLPLVINKTLNEEVLSIHSNKEKTQAGTRFYIHARNVADGILYILENIDETLDNIDASMGVFNIVGEKELDNLQFAQMIAFNIGKHLKYEMVDFHGARPGHDLRYALDGNKMKEYGWEPLQSIEETIYNIVDWTLKKENSKWLDKS